MNAVLVAINAKYPHTNLAVRGIAAYAAARGLFGVTFAEFTINQRADYILSRLYALQADVYIFSCYIWNIRLVREIAGELGKVSPRSLLWAGGPEVSWRSREFLRENPGLHLIIRGEGEETAAKLLGELPPASCPGVTFRQGDTILDTPDAPPPPLDALPFPYNDLSLLAGRVVYYESMRGCPFGCSYCVSSIRPGVRRRSLPLVFADLERFLDAGVPRLKLVDRTFNADKNHALAIWRFLMERDNGVTNFHFELAGELLDEEMTGLLAGARPGLFQFEIGVQSTNPDTLREINRPANTERLFAMVRRLQKPGNIHLHLDLIAGLPEEDFESFVGSFNEVYALAPAQLQLGFLKVLRGAAMETNAAAYGLQYRALAPYQVLSTKWLTFSQLIHLEQVEKVLDIYYNSGRFSHLVAFLPDFFPSPFEFYAALAGFWERKGYDAAPPDKVGHYQLLGEFMQDRGIPITPRAKWLCKYDMALHEKIRRLPLWADVDMSAPHRKEIAAFYRGRDAKQLHVERFPWDPATGDGPPRFLLFDYGRRDILGRAQVTRLPDSCFRQA